MSIRTLLLGAGVLLLLLVGSYFAGCRAERERWEDARRDLRDSLHLRDSAITVLRQDSARLAGQFRVDTLNLTRWRTKWDTLLARVTDTLKRTDTVTIERVIAIADSTIRSCERAFTTCEQRAQNAEAKASALAQAKGELEKILSKPKPFLTVPKVTLGIPLIALAAFGGCRVVGVCK